MSAWDLFYQEFIVEGAYISVLNGLLVTIEITILGLIIGIFLGTIIAMIKIMPKTKKIYKVLEKICDVYVGFFRGTPMMVQLLIGCFVLLPALGIIVDEFVSAIIIFGLNSGAYVSEIMRSGMQSVDPGQLEAGRALGLSYWKAMLRIVIPQSIKNILPTLGNEFIVLIKETSIVGYVAITDLTKAFRAIGDKTHEYVIPFVMLALAYLILVMLITWLIKILERRFKKSDRKL